MNLVIFFFNLFICIDIPVSNSSNPLSPWLELYALPKRTNILETLRKKDKSVKDLERIKETLKHESNQFHVGVVDIKASSSSRVPFFVTIDDQIYGPYYRIRLHPTLINDDPSKLLTLPIRTFFAIT